MPEAKIVREYNTVLEDGKKQINPEEFLRGYLHGKVVLGE